MPCRRWSRWRHTTRRRREWRSGPRFSDASLSELEGSFEDVLCLNVLDHLEEPAPMLAELARLVAPGGQVVVSLPHPAKDRGGWRKERIHGRWHYREFVLDGYFEEGPVEKSRENAAGDTVPAGRSSRDDERTRSPRRSAPSGGRPRPCRGRPSSSFNQPGYASVSAAVARSSRRHAPQLRLVPSEHGSNEITTL